MHGTVGRATNSLRVLTLDVDVLLQVAVSRQELHARGAPVLHNPLMFRIMMQSKLVKCCCLAWNVVLYGRSQRGEAASCTYGACNRDIRRLNHSRWVEELSIPVCFALLTVPLN